jgi:hypothetical protein
MTFIGWRGDPCSRCLEDPDPGRPVQRATHHGLCARHWLGASQAQRADALMEEAMTCSDEPTTPALTTESIALELLFGLAAVEPDRRAA